MSKGGFEGLNPELLGQTASQLDSEASSIKTIISQVDSLVSASIPANWSSPAAREFKEEWNLTLVPKLHDVEQALRVAARTASTHVAAQQATSTQM